MTEQIGFRRQDSRGTDTSHTSESNILTTFSSSRLARDKLRKIGCILAKFISNCICKFLILNSYFLRQMDTKKRLTSLFCYLPIACILVVCVLKPGGFYINIHLRWRSFEVNTITDIQQLISIRLISWFANFSVTRAKIWIEWSFANQLLYHKFRYPLSFLYQFFFPDPL